MEDFAMRNQYEKKSASKTKRNISKNLVISIKFWISEVE